MYTTMQARTEADAGSAAGWIDLQEEVIDLAASMFLEAWEEALEIAGPRPFGHAKASLLEQIAAFLAVASGGADAWERQIAEWSQTMSREDAERLAWAESTRLWRAIDRMGGLATVKLALAQRMIAKSEPALRSSHRILSRPKAMVRPSPAPFDPVQLIDTMLTDAAMSGPMEPPPAATAAPPASPFPRWPETITYKGIFPPPPARTQDTVPVGGSLEHRADMP